MASAVQVLPLDPASYESHWLHAGDRIWQETNCAADLWIEALHALGLDPVAGLGFTLASDFDGEQWRMFTFPAEDLRCLFGIEMDELNVWRPLAEHLENQIALGHPVIVDVDAWFLPDTAGLTYRSVHQKTSIMAQMIDVEARRLGYFHNTGYYEVAGEDFDELLGRTSRTNRTGHRLPPFCLAVRPPAAPVPAAEAGRRARRLGADHAARRPATNPIGRLRARVAEDLPWLRRQGLDAFHRYAFGSLRQCGANAELAASYVDWLSAGDGQDRAEVVENLCLVANAMKTLEFALARAARGRPCGLEPLFEQPETAWEQALEQVAATW